MKKCHKRYDQRCTFEKQLQNVFMIPNALQIAVLQIEICYAISGIIPDYGPFRMLA